MELTLPTKVNVTHPIMLDTKILVVIGANGAGKSSFGRDLLERYAGQAKRISGIHALFIAMTNLNYRPPMNSHVTVYDQRTTVHATYF